MSTPTVKIFDATLRDGSHAIRHRFTPDQVTDIAGGLDAAGVAAIGVGHGDGLGASSIQFMFGTYPDDELLMAARSAIKRAELAVTFVPGVGTRQHLDEARGLGADRARIATHCTEADISMQHIRFARELGMTVHTDLMMPHLAEPLTLVEQAKIMVDSGAQGVHIMDSAGALTLDDVKRRIDALVEGLDGQAEVGIHAHDSLSLGVANTVVAIQHGATLVDACLGGMGAGAGNCRIEALVAGLERRGVRTGIDLWALEDMAADRVAPLLDEPVAVTRESLTLGYAGVPASFLRHARSATERFDVDTRDVLVEVGRRRAVSGQEDLVLQVAADLAQPMT